MSKIPMWKKHWKSNSTLLN